MSKVQVTNAQIVTALTYTVSPYINGMQVGGFKTAVLKSIVAAIEHGSSYDVLSNMGRAYPGLVYSMLAVHGNQEGLFRYFEVVDFPAPGNERRTVTHGAWRDAADHMASYDCGETNGTMFSYWFWKALERADWDNTRKLFQAYPDIVAYHSVSRRGYATTVKNLPVDFDFDPTEVDHGDAPSDDVNDYLPKNV